MPLIFLMAGLAYLLLKDDAHGLETLPRNGFGGNGNVGGGEPNTATEINSKPVIDPVPASEPIPVSSDKKD